MQASQPHPEADWLIDNVDISQVRTPLLLSASSPPPSISMTRQSSPYHEYNELIWHAISSLLATPRSLSSERFETWPSRPPIPSSSLRTAQARSNAVNGSPPRMMRMLLGLSSPYSFSPPLPKKIPSPEPSLLPEARNLAYAPPSSTCAVSFSGWDVIRQDTYVRVIGTIKTFSNKRHLAVSAIRPVVDLNEVFYHLAEAQYMSLLMKRGKPEVRPMPLFPSFLVFGNREERLIWVFFGWSQDSLGGGRMAGMTSGGGGGNTNDYTMGGGGGGGGGNLGQYSDLPQFVPSLFLPISFFVRPYTSGQVKVKFVLTARIHCVLWFML
jgi:hypothetical protein